MQLEVGGCRPDLAAGLHSLVEVDPVLAESIGQRDTIRVLAPAELVLIAHRAGGRARAEERAPEAGALLVGPVDEPHGDLRLALVCQPTHDLDPGHDIQRPVQPAAVRDRIDVASDEERSLRAAAKSPPLVAGLVQLVLEPKAVQLGLEPLTRLPPGLRPRDALRPVLVSRQLAELL